LDALLRFFFVAGFFAYFATEMSIKIYQVDAFTEKVFGGNPAAVCPLKEWLPDATLQSIAMENNLAETAFYVETAGGFHIRWFTPAVEVDLCGHATLGAAHVLFSHENYAGDEVSFDSRSGILKVTKEDNLLTLDFPVDVYAEMAITPELAAGFNHTPLKAFKGKTDYMLVFENEEQISTMHPDLRAIAQLPGRGVIVTSKGDTADFVSRFFAPQSGIDEDPVTGSAHTTLTPYWSGVLNKKELSAIQLSPRKGYLKCINEGDRIKISGQAKTYMSGEIKIS
jgi:PhzF family phenazine biosynthesis protein